MSEDLSNPNLASFLDDVVNEVNDEMRSDEEEFDQFIESLSENEDKFTDKAFLAEGGMKNIYRVKEKQTLRNVAMAQLKGSEHNRKKILSFLREARITALLEHPNIVPIYEINQKDGLPYFTMKEIQGETLGFILSKLKENSYKYRKKYDLNSLLSIFIKVCDAIAYSHSRNIVHLDLKPDNIHVGEFGEVLVIDWGLAKDLNAKHETFDYLPEEIELKPEVTMDGFVKGTIGYMAPEQAKGENSKKDKLTDIYSLGAILYTILAFEAPYENKDLKEAIAKIAVGKYKKLLPSQSIPSALISVVERAMQPDKENRYQSVEEIRDDVQLFLNGFATKAQEATLSQLLLLFYKRNKALCTSAALFICALIIITTFFIISLKESENKANKHARLAVKNAEEASKKEAEARRLFEDLSKTIKAKDELTETSIPLIMKRVDFMKKEMEFKEAYAILSEVTSPSIQDVQYWLECGFLKLGEIKPKEALKFFDKAAAIENSQNIQNAIKFCKKYDSFSDDLSMARNYLKDLCSIQNNFLVCHFCLSLYSSWQSYTEGRIKFIKDALRIVNPQMEELLVEIHPLQERTVLNIKLNNNKKLWDISCLSGLKIDKLSLVACKGLKSLIFLKTTGIKKLDLSDTDGNKLRFRQNVYNVWIYSLEELTMKNMELKYLRLGNKPNFKLLDFAGSNLNIDNVLNQQVQDLNLCSTSLVNEASIKKLPQSEKAHNSKRIPL